MNNQTTALPEGLKDKTDSCCAGAKERRPMTPEEIGFAAAREARRFENMEIRQDLERIRARMSESPFNFTPRQGAYTRLTESIMWMEREAKELESSGFGD